MSSRSMGVTKVRLSASVIRCRMRFSFRRAWMNSSRPAAFSASSIWRRNLTNKSTLTLASSAALLEEIEEDIGFADEAVEEVHPCRWVGSRRIAINAPPGAGRAVPADSAQGSSSAKRACRPIRICAKGRAGPASGARARPGSAWSRTRAARSPPWADA